MGQCGHVGRYLNRFGVLSKDCAVPPTFSPTIQRDFPTKIFPAALANEPGCLASTSPPTEHLLRVGSVSCRPSSPLWPPSSSRQPLPAWVARHTVTAEQRVLRTTGCRTQNSSQIFTHRPAATFKLRSGVAHARMEQGRGGIVGAIRRCSHTGGWLTFHAQRAKLVRSVFGEVGVGCDVRFHCFPRITFLWARSWSESCVQACVRLLPARTWTASGRLLCHVSSPRVRQARFTRRMRTGGKASNLEALSSVRA